MSQAEKKLLLGLAAMVSALGGCRCTPPGELVVRFNRPIDGQQLSASDDLDPEAAGVQLDTQVSVTDSDGAPVALESAVLHLKLSEESDWTPGPRAQVEGGTAVFPKVTLRERANQLRVIVRDSINGETGEATITVNVTDPGQRPRVTAVAFKGDTNGDARLNSSELPAWPPVAIVTLENLENGQPVRVKSVPGGALYGVGTANNGRAEVSLAQLPNPQEAEHSLLVELENRSGVTNKLSNPSAEDPLNTSAFKTLWVDLLAPVVTVVQPQKPVLGPADDADGARPDFQLRISVLTETGSTVQMSLDGNSPAAVTNNGGSASHSFDLPATGTSEHSVLTTATDLAGNIGSASTSVTLDFEPPTLNLTAPTQAGGPYSSFTLSIRVEATGAEGRMVEIFSKPSGSSTRAQVTQVGPVSGGVASGSGTFPPGVQDVIAEVRDAAGNLASDTEAAVAVLGQGCSVQLTAPASDPAVLMQSDDLDKLAADLQFELKGSSSNCPATAVKLFKGQPGSQTLIGTTATSSAGEFALNLTLPEGQERLTVEMTDSIGVTTSDKVELTVNLSPPTLTQPPNNAVFNAGGDFQRQVSGAQRNLAYAPAAPANGSVDACTSAQLVTGAPPCRDGAAGWFTLATNVPQNAPTFTFPEGVYQLKLVLAVGTSFNVSAPVNLTVDTLRPQVTSVSFQGDANGDKRLNLAEQSSGKPVAVVATSGVEAGQTVSVKNTGSTPTVYGQGVTDGVGNATVTLSNLPSTAEADYSLVAEVTDAAGNRNVIASPTADDPLNTAAFTTLRVDRVPPVSTVVLPGRAYFGIADDADGAAGYQVRAQANTALDVKQNGMAMLLTGGTGGSAQLTPNASGSGSYDFTVLGTGTTAYTLTVTSTDESGNVGAAAAYNFTVDLDRPQLTIVSPTAAGSPYGSFSINTTVNVTGADGLNAKVFTTVTGSPEAQIGALPIAGGTASGSLTYPNGTQTVRVEVVDLAGNGGEAVAPNVTVNAIGCSIAVSSPASNPAFLNGGNDGNPSTPTVLDYTVTGNSSNCPNRSVSLYRGTGPGRTLIGGPSSTGGSGSFSFPIALPEGPETLEVEMNNGAGVITTSAVQVTVDLTAPEISAVSPAGPTLFFVASGNKNLTPPQPGYVPDGTAGGDADVSVQLTAAGAQNGSARVVYRGANVAGPVAVTSDPQSLTLPVTLTQSTTGNLEIHLVDEAGNEKVVTSSATVDVIAPAAPSVTGPAVAPGFERAAKLALSWDPTYDDDAIAGSGAHQGYDLRWTTEVVAPSGIQTDDDFFNRGSSPVTRVEPTLPWSSGTISTTVNVPPLARYWVMVRAFDEVGNYSAFAQVSSVPNFWTSTVIGNPSSTLKSFGFHLDARGDIDGLGGDELVVGSATGGPGAVYVYYSGPGFGSNPQVLAPPDTSTNGFGVDFSIGNVGDLSNEARPDLLVGAQAWQTRRGRAFLYFGRSGQQLDPAFVEFRGTAINFDFGAITRIIPDLNGDGLGEVAIDAYRDSGGGGVGRVYVYFSRTRAQWEAARTGLEGTDIFIPTSAADRIFEVEPGTTWIGRRRGYADLGDINGDGVNDFTIPASRETVSRVYVHSGKTVRDASAPIAASQAIQVLSEAVSTPDTTSVWGFGAAAFGNLNLVGGPGKDLVVSMPVSSRVYLYADGAASGFSSTPTVTIQGSRHFGAGMVQGDLNGDGRPDLVAGENSTTQGSAWVLYNQGGAAPFDTAVGSGFNQSRLSPSNGSGISVAVGDFDNDNRLDVATGDDLYVQGTTGAVFVWR